MGEQYIHFTTCYEAVEFQDGLGLLRPPAQAGDTTGTVEAGCSSERTETQCPPLPAQVAWGMEYVRTDLPQAMRVYGVRLEHIEVLVVTVDKHHGQAQITGDPVDRVEVVFGSRTIPDPEIAELNDDISTVVPSLIKHLFDPGEVHVPVAGESNACRLGKRERVHELDRASRRQKRTGPGSITPGVAMVARMCQIVDPGHLQGYTSPRRL